MDEWILPKGGVERGESLEDTASRETQEEAGVKGTVKLSLGSNQDKKTTYNWFYFDVEGIIYSYNYYS
jgi:ADP-ribose pyrophosphatase YjhB (NUDIX family)